MTRTSVDPEREMVRRAAPFGPPLALVALLIGALAGGWGVGVSAALGVVMVTLNLVANGLATARAARVSLTALSAVVWPCMIGKGEFCFNFIMLLLLIAFAATILFFVTGLRNPKVVPGRFQNLVEYGLDFVRTQIGQQMIGPRAEPFMPFLATLFFFIFFGNILEIVP